METTLPVNPLDVECVCDGDCFGGKEKKKKNQD